MLETGSNCIGFAAAFSLYSPLQKLFQCHGTMAEFSAVPRLLCKAASTLGSSGDLLNYWDFKEIHTLQSKSND